MALFSPAATVSSVSLFCDVKETVVPFIRRLIVSAGLSLPLPMTAPLAVAWVARAVMLTGQLALVRFLLLGLETMLTPVSELDPSASNSPCTDVGWEA